MKGQTNSLSKFVNIQYKGNQFQAVLDQFSAQTSIQFAYSTAIVPLPKTYNVQFQNVRANKALKDFLHQNGLDFELTGNTAILKKWSQKNNTKQYFYSGRVLEDQTGERLVKATVTIPALNRFTLTDEFGVFRIAIPETSVYQIDTITISINYPGYDTYTDTFFSKRNYFLTAVLKPTIERIQPTLINANKSGSRLAVIQGQSDQFLISSTRLQQMPALLGEADVMRALSLTPGVVSGSEGMLGMYVRGGAADQNLVLLDDVPVFNAYHLYGIFGVFNGDIIKSAQMNRGSFSPEYGGRLSSVISVQSIDGNENQWSANANLGALTSKIAFQGPLWKKRTTVAFAFRRSNFDFLTQTITNAVFNNSNSSNHSIVSRN